MLVDYHTHHYRCGHAKGNLIDYARRAARLGLREIGFSDHAPIYHLGDHPHAYPTAAMSQLELPNYIAEAQDVQAAMRGTIDVRIGIESDYLPDLEEHYRRLWDQYPLDYRIGSAHWLGKWSIFRKDLPEERTSESILQEYLETTVALAKSGIYDIVAHLDCLKTAGVFDSARLARALENTIGVLADNNIVVEYNTSGWRKPINEAYPSDLLLRMCHACGVEMTLGSDAHQPEEVGYAFAQAVTHLRQVGYTEVVTFRNRQKGKLSLTQIPTAIASGG